MLPSAIKSFLRLFSIAVSVLLAGVLWLVLPSLKNAFLLRGWVLIAAASLCAVILPFVLFFFRPKKGQLPFLSAFLLLLASITGSVYCSRYCASAHSALIWAGLIICVIFLRLSRRSADEPIVLGVLSLSGCFAAICTLVCRFGVALPFLTALNRTYLIYYLGAASFASLALAAASQTPCGRIFNFALFALQAAAVFVSRDWGVILPFIVGFFVFLTSFWCVKPGKLLKKTPFAAGLMLTILILSLYMGVYHAVCSYTPSELCTENKGYAGAAYRLASFHTSFFTFLKSPYVGHGPGALSMLAPCVRPSYLNKLEAKNDDDIFCSGIMQVLNEIGFLGLFALCTALISAFAIALRILNKTEAPRPAENLLMLPEAKPAKAVEGEKKDAEKDEEKDKEKDEKKDKEKDEKKDKEKDAEKDKEKDEKKGEEALNSGITAVITAVSDKWPSFCYLKYSFFVFISAVGAALLWQGVIGIGSAVYFVPISLLGFALQNLYANLDADDLCLFNRQCFARASVSAICFFVCLLLYTRSAIALPMLALLALLFSVNASVSLKDVCFKKKYSFMALLFVFLSAVYALNAFNAQKAYHIWQVCLSEGQALNKSQNSSAAQKAFERALKANPESVKALFGLAVSLKNQNKLDEAQDIFKGLSLTAPNAFNSSLELAEILLKKNQLLEAHKYALKAVEVSASSRAYRALAYILMLEGKSSEAEGIMKEALTSASNQTEAEKTDLARLKLCLYGAKVRAFNQAKEFIEKITQESILKTYEYAYLKGQIYFGLGAYEKALLAFEEANSYAKKSPQALNAVGYTLVMLNRNQEKAEALLLRAYKLVKKTRPPKLLELLSIAHSLGHLYWQKGELKKAEGLLKTAWQETPPEEAELKNNRLMFLIDFYAQTGMSIKAMGLKAAFQGH